MHTHLNISDVPAVSASDLGFVLQILVERGQGLALLRGLHENEIREIEDRVWAEFDGADDLRLAVALRFRALLDVFAARRLKALFLERGFRLLAAAAQEAAALPLNVRFGFNAQKLLLALDVRTIALSELPEEHRLPLAA